MACKEFEWLTSFIKQNDIYTEEYIGALPEIARVTKDFEIIIQEVKKNPHKINPNALAANKDLIKTLEKFFGLKELDFYWIPENDINAYTVTMGFMSGINRGMKSFKRTKGRGFYDESHTMTWCIQITTGLITKIDLNARELTAVILHELGHNCQLSYLDVLGSILATFTLVWTSLKGKTAQGAQDVLTDTKKQAIADDVKRSGDMVYAAGDRTALAAYDDSKIMIRSNPTVFNAVTQLVTFLTSIPKDLEGKYRKPDFGTKKTTSWFLFVQLASASNRLDEQWADSFATAYGYGPDLISSLRKMSQLRETARMRNLETPVDTLLRDMNECYREVYKSLIDSHGSEQRRARDCIYKLKQDLYTISSPKMREEIEKQIAEIEAEYNLLVNCEPEVKDSAKRDFRIFMSKLHDVVRIEDLMSKTQM